LPTLDSDDQEAAGVEPAGGVDANTGLRNIMDPRFHRQVLGESDQVTRNDAADEVARGRPVLGALGRGGRLRKRETPEFGRLLGCVGHGCKAAKELTVPSQSAGKHRWSGT